MNELKIPTNLERISLNEQTNYRLMVISSKKFLSSGVVKKLQQGTKTRKKNQ